jgi:hypothetical protein
MAAPVVKVLTPESNPKLFSRLPDVEAYGDISKTLQPYVDLCEGADDFATEPHRVGWLADQPTHILQLIAPLDGKKQMVTFAYLNVKPFDMVKKTSAVDYAELVLLCGSYKFVYGSTTWKGSEVLIDKAMELARVAGKTALRLEALNETLYKKVYEPMGFKPVPGEHLIYERPLPSGGKKTRRRNRRQRKTRHRKTKVRGKR